jgi:hypothetical protein
VYCFAEIGLTLTRSSVPIGERFLQAAHFSGKEVDSFAASAGSELLDSIADSTVFSLRQDEQEYATVSSKKLAIPES